MFLCSRIALWRLWDFEKLGISLSCEQRIEHKTSSGTIIMSVLSVSKKPPFINLSYATFKFQYIHPRLGCLGWNSTLIWVFCSVTLTGEKMILLRNVINVDAFKLDFPNILWRTSWSRMYANALRYRRNWLAENLWQDIQSA